MSSRITSVGRSLSDEVPFELDATAPAVTVNLTNDSTSSVSLTTDGLIDWWWLGSQSPPNLPWVLANTSLFMKRYGTGALRNGFRWQFSALAVSSFASSASSRSMTASASDILVNQNTNINSNVKCGYSVSASPNLVNVGFQMALSVSEVQRRLRCYVVPVSCDVQLNAKVYGNDGRTATASQTATAGSGVTAHSIFEVLFSGPSLGGKLVIDCRVITQNNTSANIGIQSFSLT